MNTQEVADRLVALCKEGKNLQAVDELYADDVLSLEPEGAPDQRSEGKDAAIKKNEKFFESLVEMHSTSISAPVVAGPYFSIAMGFDMTFKEYGRVKMDEVAVYYVKDGKVAEEQFFYKM